MKKRVRKKLVIVLVIVIILAIVGILAYNSNKNVLFSPFIGQSAYASPALNSLYPASKAIDGSATSYFMACKNANLTNNKGTFVYDLGGVKTVDNVTIDFAQSNAVYPGTAPCSYTVSVSSDNSVWSTIYSRQETATKKCNSTSTYSRSPDVYAPLVMNKNIRYIKLDYTKVNDGSGWCLAMNEISANEKTTPCVDNDPSDDVAKFGICYDYSDTINGLRVLTDHPDVCDEFGKLWQAKCGTNNLCVANYSFRPDNNMSCVNGMFVKNLDISDVRVELTSEYCDVNQRKCWVSDKVNSQITTEVFIGDLDIDRVDLKIYDTNRNLIKEQMLTSPKPGKFMTTFDFLEKAGNYSAEIMGDNVLLYTFKIESVGFDSNLKFSSVKNVSGKKITLAYYSRDFDLNELKEFTGVVSGYGSNNGLLNLEPVSNYLNKFEIVAVSAPRDIRGNLLTDFIDYNVRNENTSFILYINVYKGQEGENRASGGVFCSMSESGMNVPIDAANLSLSSDKMFYFQRTIAHEFGHSFGCLGDEYFENPPAFQYDRPNIDIEGCPKWCSGKLNESKQDYSNYTRLKSCLSPYIDSQTKLFRNYDLDKEAINNCFYTTIIEKGNPVVVERYSDKSQWDLGDGCIQGTGCYFTANGLMEWRPQTNTIMRHSWEPEADFGVIGKREIGNKLNSLFG